ncbi:S-layer homology domain-containing protein [Caldalkalibacillus thermarum TA2.A1]|nr:S-layer homology domain-containing protein [Caldalkalibacillus thermarum TA2.A1]
MAAPHVAGLAALLREAYPDLSVFEIKALIMNTAVKVGSHGEYTLRDMGAGLVQGHDAFLSPVLAKVPEIAYYTKHENGIPRLTAAEHYTGLLNYRMIKPDDGESLKSMTVELQNISDQPVTYYVDWDFLDEKLEGKGVSLSLSTDEVTVPANSHVELSVTLMVEDGAQYGIYEGYITFTTEQYPDLNVPFIVYLGHDFDKKGIDIVSITPQYFNTEIEQIVIRYKLHNDVKLLWLFIYDRSQDEVIGIIDYFTDSSKGEKTYSWNKYYYDFDTEQLELISDGVYSLYMVAVDHANLEYHDWIDFYVYSQPPQVRIKQAENDNISIVENFVNGEVMSLFSKLGIADTTIDVFYKILKEEKVYHSGRLSVDHAGYFELRDVFPEGISKLELELRDIAGNSATQTFSVELSKVYLLENIHEQQSIAIGNTITLVFPPYFVKGSENDTFEIKFSTKKYNNRDFKPNYTSYGPVYSFSLYKNGELLKQPFDKPVRLIINTNHLDLNKLEEQMISAYFVEQTPIHVGGRAKEGRFEVELDRFGEIILMTYDPGFIDVGRFPWAEDSIRVLASQRIINGVSSTRFAPENDITRAQFVTILVNVLDLEKKENGASIVFSDVVNDPHSKWYGKNLDIAVSHGIVTGVGQNRFNPHQSISRSEMATMLARALRVFGYESKDIDLSQYKDAGEIPWWAEEGFKLTVDLGIITGTNRGLEPRATGNRAQAVVMLKRLYDLIYYPKDE